MESFPHTSRAGFVFIWWVSFTHPVLALFLSGEFLLHIPCWLHFSVGSFSHTSCAGFLFHLGSFSYTSHAGFYFYLWSFSYTPHAWLLLLLPPPPPPTFLIWGVSLTHPVLALFFSGEFLLHIPCWLLLLTSWGVSLTHPMLPSFLCGEFLSYILCWLLFSSGKSRADLIFVLGTFSYTSRAGFIFLWEVSLAHTMRDSFTLLLLIFFFFFFIWGVSLAHPVLALFFSGEFLSYILCWLPFSSGKFILHIPCWLLFLSGELLLHTPRLASSSSFFYICFLYIFYF